MENVSNRTVILPDIRAEIGPGKQFDFAKIARIIDIERSRDLFTAIKAKLLKFVKKSVNKIKVEKPPSEDVFKRLMEEAVAEAIKKSSESKQVIDMTKIKETVERQIAASLKKQQQAPDNDKISEKLDNLIQMMSKSGGSTGMAGSAGDADKVAEPQVSLEDLASITQKGVQNVASEIKSSGDNKPKKIKLDTRAIDLAKELNG